MTSCRSNSRATDALKYIPSMESNHMPNSDRSHQQGFTLVELMVVVALVAILATIATPSWNRMIVSNRIRAAVNDWTLSAQFARSEALRRNESVTLCPSNNGTGCTSSDYETGWIVIASNNTSAGTRVLQDTLPKERLTMVQAIRRVVTFLPNGLLVGNFTGAHITVRDLPASDISLTRHICIARTGRIKVYTNEQFMNLSTSACGN